MVFSGYEYLCAGGETFDSVALHVYGDEKYAADLLCANPKYCGRAVFEGGERLLVPVVEGESGGEAAYTPAAAPWKE